MEPNTASSRIFVKGLPPTFTEAEFKKHFSSQREITDAKIFPNRRIGYVGYKTPEDAQKAVKYFNRTFIRMSKIGVDIARPVQDAKTFEQGRNAPTAKKESSSVVEGKGNQLKRKRNDGQERQDDDPELKEFLEVMKPKSKKKAWENEQNLELQAADESSGRTEVQVEAAQSDDEYEEVPKKAKRRKSESKETTREIDPTQQTTPEVLETEPVEDAAEPDTEASKESQPAVSDSDWARSRTSRLLGLLDDEEEEDEGAQERMQVDSDDVDDEAPEEGGAKTQQLMEPESSIPTPPSDVQDEDLAPSVDPKVEAVRSSMRLFVRNLPYGVKGEDLEAEFESFGNVEEVCIRSLSSLVL